LRKIVHTTFLNERLRVLHMARKILYQTFAFIFFKHLSPEISRLREIVVIVRIVSLHVSRVVYGALEMLRFVIGSAEAVRKVVGSAIYA